MAKIVFYNVKKSEKAYLQKKLKKHKLTFYTNSINDKNIQTDAEVISTFIDSGVSVHKIEKMPDLKIICTRSTGFDHIDTSAAAARNIPVCTVPFYGENTVAEHAFGLLLSLTREIHYSHLRTKKSDFSLKGLMGFDLRGKKIGILGGGHIGLHLAQMARGFNMDVFVADTHEQPFLGEVFDFAYAPVDKIISQSDVISLHLPYNKHTHHILNKKNMNKLKKGVVLINTARGGLIETKALHTALKDGTIRSAGLDVLEHEEFILQPKLKVPKKFKPILKLNREIIKMKNVIFTAHNSFNSEEAVQRILDMTVENIQNGLKGKVQNKVN